jgi:hypothetical protein
MRRRRQFDGTPGQLDGIPRDSVGSRADRWCRHHPGSDDRAHGGRGPDRHSHQGVWQLHEAER